MILVMEDKKMLENNNFNAFFRVVNYKTTFVSILHKKDKFPTFYFTFALFITFLSFDLSHFF